MRTRSRTDIPAEDQCYSSKNSVLINAGMSSNLFGLVYTTDTHTESITDVVTPDYRGIVRRGGIVNNPCSYSSLTLSDSGGGEVTHTTISGQYPEGVGIMTKTGPVTQFYAENSFGLQSIDFGSNSIEDAHTDAMAYAISQIDASDFGFGEDVAEIKETLRFLRNPITSLTKVNRSHKKKAYKLARKRNAPIWHLTDDHHAALRQRAYLQALSDTYLGYRFAYTPLVRSISDAVDALAYRTVKRKEPPRLTARGFSEFKVDSGLVQTAGLDGSIFQHREQAHVGVSAQILYATSGISRNSQGNILGLRTKDIPETLWAVMPYSFMIDRVLNVSQMIRGITNLSDPRINILAASTTERVDQTRSYKLEKISEWDTANWKHTTNGNTVEEHSFSYNRAIWSPSVKDTVGVASLAALVDDTQKIADLTALILSRVL